MRAVWSWLLDLCELDQTLSPDEGADALTGLGLEVEAIERPGDGVKGVVVAEVVSKAKHPKADKLTVVQVVDGEGGETATVVCGAPNVPDAGGKVVWARPGAVLPGGFVIGKKALKGVDSAGMLCSEVELEVGGDGDGIIVLGGEDARQPPGTDAASVLRLGEVILDIGVPANRADALGHLGLARELCAAVGGRLLPWEHRALAGDEVSELVSVDIEKPGACSRYMARVVDGVTIGPSPWWLKARLHAVGVRPVSNVVDATNYVMFELGHPLHAFDYAAINGQKIVVRHPRTSEKKIRTLDGQDRQLDPADLLICDAGRELCIAGVMGGLDSEVTGSTTRVLLEAASFEPVGIRRTGRRMNLHSESSHRFERGVDPAGVPRASESAAALIARIAGGSVAKGVVDAYPHPTPAKTVPLRCSRVQAIGGVPAAPAVIGDTLSRLEFDVSSASEQDFDVVVPTFRGDVTREIDLIEEFLRVYGFHRVPAELPGDAVAPSVAIRTRAGAAREALLSAGLSESLTFAFTSPNRLAAFEFQDEQSRPVVIRNPLSIEQSVMRTTLLANLLGAVSRNLSYGVKEVALFEVGSVFFQAPDAATSAREELRVSAVMTGHGAGWLTKGDGLDFFDIKGVVDQVCTAAIGGTASFVGDRDEGLFHPGICARIQLDDLQGHVGEVHPRIREAFEIEPRVFAFELALVDRPLDPKQMSPIARYPSATRDISMFLDSEIPAQRVRDVVASREEALVEQLEVLEDYRDPQRVPAGKKGMLWSITYRAADRTLTDKEVDAAHDPIVRALLDELAATQR